MVPASVSLVLSMTCTAWSCWSKISDLVLSGVTTMMDGRLVRFTAPPMVSFSALMISRMPFAMPTVVVWLVTKTRLAILLGGPELPLPLLPEEPPQESQSASRSTVASVAPPFRRARGCFGWSAALNGFMIIARRASPLAERRAKLDLRAAGAERRLFSHVRVAKNAARTREPNGSLVVWKKAGAEALGSWRFFTGLKGRCFHRRRAEAQRCWRQYSSASRVLVQVRTLPLGAPGRRAAFDMLKVPVRACTEPEMRHARQLQNPSGKGRPHRLRRGDGHADLRKRRVHQPML